jgi:hypothetical protein
MKRIGIVLLATNAYYVLGVRFIKRFMHFYTGDNNIVFYFYSDDDPSKAIPENINVKYYHDKHDDWVEATNSKFKNIIDIQDSLRKEVDFVYYFDADTNINQPFDESWFLGDLVGGEHYGNRSFLKDCQGFDRNPESKAYVPYDTPYPCTYHYGAFFGGNTENVIKFCETLRFNQLEDKKIPYEPGVNDESYINQYFHVNPPTYTVPTEKFAFAISDKGGLGETRNTHLDVVNIREQVKKNKYKLFNISNNELIVEAGKVTIYTTHYNRPEFVQLQYNQLKKYCTDDFEYVVINNGVDEEIADQISNECNGIREIKIVQSNRQPYCSHDHIKCLEQCYNNHISKDVTSDIRVVMDSDIFPFKEFSFYDIIQTSDMCGLYYDGGHEYSSAIFTAYSKKVDLEEFQICGGFGDSGSGTKNLIDKYNNRWIKHTAPIRKEEMPYVIKPDTLYKHEYGFHFIEECLVHFYRGSGWDTGHIGEYHNSKYNCLLDLLSDPDKYILGFPSNINYEYALLEQYGRPDKYRLNSKRILILVMSSQIHMVRRDSIVNSYGKRVKDYPNIDLIFYSDDDDPSTNTFKMDVPLQMKYSDNEIKTIGAIDLIEQRYHNQYDWYLFIDDDTFVNIPLLNEKIFMFDEDFVHGRDITGCMGDLEYVSGGAGILISNKIVGKLFKMVCYNTHYSDVNVGMNLRDRNIKIRNSILFNPSNPYRENGIQNLKEDVKSNITYHYLYPSMMKQFDDMITNS